jgi:hypothetical protein
LAGAQKECRAEGHTIVFIDESGLSEQPTQIKSSALKGQTPLLQYSFNWKQLALIAGVVIASFYFRFFRGAIKSPQIIDFLKALTRRNKGMLAADNYLERSATTIVSG